MEQPTPHPFLDQDFHIRWSQLTPEHIEADITEALARAEAKLDAVAGADRGRMSFDSTVLALESATDELSRAWGLVGHLDSVADSDALRKVHNKMLPAVSEFYAKIPLDEGLWDLLKTYEATPDASALTGIRQRFFTETMADFRESGAELPEKDKKRLEEIEAELAQTTQGFGEHVLDSTNAWEKIIEDESLLAGLPETAKAAALADAKARDLATDDAPKWRFTLQAPSYMPVMEHLEDTALRTEFWRASTGIGHHAEDSKYDNTDLVWKTLALRHEKAQILGKTHFADLVLERRMAKDGKTALTFIEDLAKRIAPAFNREVNELQQYRADSLNEKVSEIEPWDIAFWSEKRRKELYDFDDEDLRPYFEISNVLDGMFRLVEKVLDVRIHEKKTGTGKDEIEVWHEDVRYYEITDPRGIHLGSFYADWHPRDSKRAGAWMNYLITGSPPTEEEDRKPHLGLICGNLTPPAGDRPALLTHYEVETVFHEFGHLLHHLLGEVEIRSMNGVNVAWDFVELPSQIMENFCWERESLDFFARHYQTGEPIPQKLFKKMLAARNYMSATTTMRQLALSKLDLDLHMHHATGGSGRDLDALARTILEGYLVPLATPVPTMARRFTHLFSSSTGYAAGYYSYKWAEVLDADAFTRFQKEGVLNPEVGRSFREEILSKGNSAPPETLFRNFMGRDPDLSALMVRSGLAKR